MSFGLTKRHKIIITSVILAVALLSTGFMSISFYLNYKLQIIVALLILSLVLSAWALWEGLTFLKGTILMVLPMTFTLSVTSYYFLLPTYWYLRFPVALLFGIIWYTLLLSQNVFNVSSIRTIPLYRVASTVVFVLTITTASLLFNVIFSLHMLYIFNGLVVLALCFPLILQLLWSVEMERVDSILAVTSLFMGIVVSQVAIALSFWPVSNAVASVMLTAVLYLVCGISMDSLRGRLSREVVWGYFRWGAPVLLLVYLTTSWTG
ncbi:hypothetical protein A3C32_01220 [Candidatus Daviesbacteria bacterium RIFCSPHIGHO2_02_FULL_41_14]|uniref:Uncharacterized protein n=1 Tax=Candidatus Daviesbacteria bacterium RIFCSPLOWO2_01_FULL_40_24 TaxID=1797787 RepID=A0A1F5MK12_9BACT|nr:MAG: hypothetical protein A2780_02350 [Candidatus Daviesbacteria bacterium RIFCSPHIGHO2_01_FULL_41_45]OGE35020.1 MAG: hypothetical protein A3C32_01220 [Candidatus Daviesbacteria bacterium RIFCSPHIGHO2_02_FULL_41_14]OGE65727.1 MAG: hypothetical protein A3B49_02630 [Candidatus Daviesbacteria bacterium RIFCSPLOWO2_01_FULL_40_24]